MLIGRSSLSHTGRISRRRLPNHVPVAIYNIGIDYYVTDNFVLDVRFGVGLNEQTDDFFSGVGGGLRF